MQRDPASHKGENGKVAVIGGSRTMHGAPLICALGAEASGVDLVYVCLPRCHEEAAKNTSLNFQVHSFAGDDIGKKDVEPILELLATMDCAVLGPGIGKEEKFTRPLLDIVAEATCPLVLDASALQPTTLSLLKGKKAVCTPHLGELERMEIAPSDLGKMAKDAGVTLFLKGQVDRVAHPDGMVTEISGGNAGLSVGGTGDALAGLIAGLIAQRVEIKEACTMAGTIIKRAATLLFHEYGYAFGTKRIIEQISRLLHTYEGQG